VNATLAELKLNQDEIRDEELDDQPLPPSDVAAVWEAITRLDNMVVNNTVKVRPIRTHHHTAVVLATDSG